jgi:hypothetical protein
MKRTKAVLLGAILALVAGSTVASAGQTQSAPVVIDYSLNYATGNLGAARNSSDNQQFIGCEVEALAGDSFIWVTCQAQDAHGNSIRCLSKDPTLVQTVSTLKSDSWLYFDWINAASPGASVDCAMIRVRTSSIYEPKR